MYSYYVSIYNIKIQSDYEDSVILKNFYNLEEITNK